MASRILSATRIRRNPPSRSAWISSHGEKMRRARSKPRSQWCERYQWFALLTTPCAYPEKSACTQCVLKQLQLAAVLGDVDRIRGIATGAKDRAPVGKPCQPCALPAPNSQAGVGEDNASALQPCQKCGCPTSNVSCVENDGTARPLCLACEEER